MKVKIWNTSEQQLPQYATKGSAGLDIRANIASPVTIKPGQTALITTGLHIELPTGYEARIRSRSGLSPEHGVIVLNSPGCVDSDYRGDIGVILANLGQENYTVKPGERIAQMIVSKYEQVEWVQVESQEDLTTSERNDGAFGHSGKC